MKLNPTKPIYNVGLLFRKIDIDEALLILRDGGDDRHRRLREIVVMPRMPHINKVTGQDNDPDYMAYMLEFVCASHL